MRKQLCVLFIAALQIIDATAQNDQYKLNLNMAVQAKTAVAAGILEISWKIPSGTNTIPIAFDHVQPLQNLIKKISVNNSTATFKDSKSDGVNGFEITSPTALLKDQKATIIITFQTDTIRFDNSMNFLPAVDKWIPMVPLYREGKFWWKEKGLKDFSADISLPKEYKAATTGMIRKEEIKNNIRYLNTDVKDVTEYGICISDKFITEETDANGTKIISYFFEDDAKWGRKLLEMAKDVVLFYKKEIGFYPSAQMSILPGVNRPIGGYPISANMFVIHRGLDQKGDNFANWIIAHELGHYYWGFGYILSDHTYTGWFGLSMGLSTDWLYSNYKGLDLSVYDFHIRYMAGYLAGYNTTILQPEEKLDKDGFDYNNVISHGKSFTVIRMLESIVGKEIFLKIFREFISKYKGRSVDYATFKRICEQISGKNLEWFFHEWYETNAAVDYRISRTKTTVNKNGKLNVTCNLSRYGEAVMPLDIEVAAAGKTFYKTQLEGSFKDTAIYFETDNVPFEITLDPEKKLPLVERYESDSTTIMQSASFIINSLKDYGLAIKHLDKLKRTEMNNPRFLFYYGFALRGMGEMQSAIEYFERATLQKESPTTIRCLLELGKTYDLLNMREKALEYYKQCLTRPSVAQQAQGFINAPYKEN